MPQAPEDARPRRKLALAMVILAVLLGFLAVLSVWANRQALETDNWTETSTELLEDEEIRDQVSAFLVDELFAQVDVQGELAQTLPPRLLPLAGPAAAGLRELTGRAADRALAAPRFQALWEDANREAHETLLRVVEDDSDEPVTLDLSSLAQGIGDRAGIDIASRLPDDAAQIVILEPEQLSAAQRAVSAIHRLAILLSVLTLGLLAGTVALARGWRRDVLRLCGFAFVAIGVLVLIVRAIAGDALVDALASSAAVEPAVDETWDIGTSLLSDGGQAMILYGAFILLAAWLAGPSGAARWVRRSLAPLMSRPGTAYLTLLVLLALLFTWAPTEGFRRLPVSVLLVALLAGGFEVLRRHTAREFPDETWDRGMERLRAALARLMPGPGASG